DRLVCPVDRVQLETNGEELVCSGGHHFPVVQGVSILLVDRPDPTHPYCAESIDSARGPGSPSAEPAPDEGGAVDPFVQNEIVKTNGNLYRHLEGRLTRYPIPSFRMPPGEGRSLLDVGSNWGRWTLAALQVTVEVAVRL